MYRKSWCQALNHCKLVVKYIYGYLRDYIYSRRYTHTHTSLLANESRRMGTLSQFRLALISIYCYQSLARDLTTPRIHTFSQTSLFLFRSSLSSISLSVYLTRSYISVPRVSLSELTNFAPSITPANCYRPRCVQGVPISAIARAFATSSEQKLVDASKREIDFSVPPDYYRQTA